MGRGGWRVEYGGLTHEVVSARIQVRPLSITVSTTGFHPVNAGSTPAEVTKLSEFEPFGSFLLLGRLVCILKGGRFAR